MTEEPNIVMYLLSWACCLVIMAWLRFTIEEVVKLIKPIWRRPTLTVPVDPDLDCIWFWIFFADLLVVDVQEDPRRANEPSFCYGAGSFDSPNKTSAKS